MGERQKMGRFLLLLAGFLLVVQASSYTHEEEAFVRTLGDAAEALKAAGADPVVARTTKAMPKGGTPKKVTSACRRGMYDAGGADPAAQKKNCQMCSNLRAVLFGGKGRKKGLIPCQAACDECERPYRHPTHGSICWKLKVNKMPDANWQLNKNPDVAPVGNCVCKSNKNVCKRSIAYNGQTQYFCRQVGMRFKADKKGNCAAPGREEEDDSEMEWM